MVQTNASNVELNSGHSMPRIGLGTFQATQAGEVERAVKAAVEQGYRLIDCAAAYGNQAEVGTALAGLIKNQVVKRSDLFVVSKIFQTHHDWEGDGSRCEEAINSTLQELQLDYLDLYLIHWPFAFEQRSLLTESGEKIPLRQSDGSPNPIWNVEVEYLKTWAALEKLVASGRVKAIGVSNFTVEQVDHLLKHCTIKPAVHQFELHPYNSQRSLLEHHAKHGIVPMGYSPMGSSFDQRWPPAESSTLLKHPVVREIAETLEKTPAQVLIRWSLQQAVVIPKSVNPTRIQENWNVQDWSLTDEHMTKLDKLNADFRYFLSYLKKPSNNIRWHDGHLDEAC